MKRTHAGKLALHRETLASLDAGALADVAGGNALSPQRTTLTPVLTRQSCQFICRPQQSLLGCMPTK